MLPSFPRPLLFRSYSLNVCNLKLSQLQSVANRKKAYVLVLGLPLQYCSRSREAASRASSQESTTVLVQYCTVLFTRFGRAETY